MPMKMGTQCPDFDCASDWINGDEKSIKKALQSGKPTLVHFWAVSCGICKENMPRIAQWRDEQKGNLNVVAVHMPRYKADTDVDAVRADIEKYNITEPCAIDNRHKLKAAFQNEQGWVPAYYLFDGEGKLKSFAAGERGFGMLKIALERLLTSQMAVSVV
jgi:thiol-disulfide isomerase/thioredoxin